MTTLKDIARRTNLDISTISRSLNDSPRVKDSTKEYVQQVAMDMGYKKNEIARSLATKKTNTIGVIFSDVSSPFFSELIKGIEFEANENKYSIFLCDADWDSDREAKYLEVLTSRKVDGLLIHTSFNSKKEYLKVYKDINTPLVLLANFFEDIKDYSVGIDNYKGAYEVTSYLISLGHKNILHVTNEVFSRLEHYKILIDRLNGYKDALKDAGIKFREDLVIEASTEFSDVRQKVKEFLSNNKNNISSIFAASDWTAIASLKAIQDLGFKVPQDYSVAGFDNVAISAIFNPSLTTYDQPKYEIGIKATQILLEILAGKKPKRRDYMIESEGLIIRKSCIPYKK